MIEIKDDDLPIIVAEKLIHATKPYNPTPFARAFAQAVTGNDNAADTQDMFSEDDLREIIGYIEVYLKYNE